MASAQVLTVFVCSRRRTRQYSESVRHYCVVCLADGKKIHAPILCDFRTEIGGPTCDKGLCREHAVKQGFEDYCPAHDPKESK